MTKNARGRYRPSVGRVERLDHRRPRLEPEPHDGLPLPLGRRVPGRWELLAKRLCDRLGSRTAFVFRGAEGDLEGGPDGQGHRDDHPVRLEPHAGHLHRSVLEGRNRIGSILIQTFHIPASSRARVSAPTIVDPDRQAQDDTST